MQYIVTYHDVDGSGTSTTSVWATCKEQAIIKANVWYYGETIATDNAKVEVWSAP